MVSRTQACIKDKAEHTLSSYPTGNEKPTEVGDLLIYTKAYLKIGHVAVISKIDSTVY